MHDVTKYGSIYFRGKLKLQRDVANLREITKGVKICKQINSSKVKFFKPKRRKRQEQWTSNISQLINQMKEQASYTSEHTCFVGKVRPGTSLSSFHLTSNNADEDNENIRLIGQGATISPRILLSDIYQYNDYYKQAETFRRSCISC